MAESKIDNEGVTTIFLRPVFLIIIIIALGGFAAYSYVQYKGSQSELLKLKTDPNSAAIEETKELVEKVGELTELPEGEEPTVATVTDIEKIKDQPFFVNAQNEDKVLIFSEAKRAVLYRPSSNKIVEVAPINIDEQEGIEQEDGEAVAGIEDKDKEEPKPKRVTLALYNSTDTSGLTTVMSDDLEKNIVDVEFDVVLRENAKGEYEKTLVVDISGGNGDVAKKIATHLNADVGDFPEDEPKPDADILVIVGSDYVKE